MTIEGSFLWCLIASIQVFEVFQPQRGEAPVQNVSILQPQRGITHNRDFVIRAEPEAIIRLRHIASAERGRSPLNRTFQFFSPNGGFCNSGRARRDNATEAYSLSRTGVLP